MSALNDAVSVPSASTVSGTACLSSAIRPPLVFIVGVMMTFTSVPRITAMSPPSSIFSGSRPVYAGNLYSSPSLSTYGTSTTFSV